MLLTVCITLAIGDDDRPTTTVKPIRMRSPRPSTKATTTVNPNRMKSPRPSTKGSTTVNPNHMKSPRPSTKATTTADPRRYKSKRTTRSRSQVVVPPVSCPDLFEATADLGDTGLWNRKTQHNSDCKKYFECVANRWLVLECPDGTTFNLQDKNCDSEKSCLPRTIDELFIDGVDELKNYLGIGDPDDDDEK